MSDKIKIVIGAFGGQSIGKLIGERLSREAKRAEKYDQDLETYRSVDKRQIYKEIKK